MAKTSKEKPIEMEPDAMERMNRALREAMKTPPKSRKAEAKRGKSGKAAAKERKDAKHR